MKLFKSGKMNLYKAFDHLGILAFLFITIDSIIYMVSGVSDWRVNLRFAVGLAGLLVDVYLVFVYKGDEK